MSFINFASTMPYMVSFKLLRLSSSFDRTSPLCDLFWRDKNKRTAGIAHTGKKREKYTGEIQQQAAQLEVASREDICVWMEGSHSVSSLHDKWLLDLLINGQETLEIETHASL